MVKLIECPRDAMQGLHEFIPTEIKAAYLNQLLRVGFDSLDFGSFVSPKAIPQMQDTAGVLEQLDISTTKTRLLAIVANYKGAVQAASYEPITYLGYPLSISETFQLKNTNKTIVQSMELVQEIQNLCLQTGKQLVAYISMGFGNHFGDPYNEEIVLEFAQKLAAMEIKIISLADTIGVSNPENIRFLFETLIPRFPDIEFGAHLHATPAKVEEKLEAAYGAGCRRFDGALLGFGGCPMAEDELVGNMPTEKMIAFFEEKNIATFLEKDALYLALQEAGRVFGQFQNHPSL